MPEDTDITTEPLTVQDILDEANESVGYHTILEVWREVLRPSQTESVKQITPQWANRICSSYRDINFRDMPVFRNIYFNKVTELAYILDVEIGLDDECLNVFTPEEDAQNNGSHYMNILVEWQKALLMWELAWDCTDPTAGCELAAISEVHRMFFGDTGMTSLLDNIQFEVTEADQEMLAATLRELKESQEGQ